MPFTVQMPELGESVTEGTVVRWLKAVGDSVDIDEPLLEVSTDKVDTEIPSPVAGTLTRIVAAVDMTVDIGAALAIIDDAGPVPSPAAGSNASPTLPADDRAAAPGPGWYRERGDPRTFRYWDGGSWHGRPWSRPAGVFLSYARTDADAMQELTADLAAFKVPTWRDRELAGGDVWWDEILRQIRGAAAFVHLLSDASLASEACRAERGYAEALGIPVVPVQVGVISNPRSRRELLTQVVDYRERDDRRTARLLAAVQAGIDRRWALPDPPPAPPDFPFSYIRRLSDAIENRDLTFEEQRRVCWDLQDHLRVESDRSARSELWDLLRKLRRRPDVPTGLVEYIDVVLRSAED